MKTVKWILTALLILMISACGKEEVKKEVLRPVKYEIVKTADANKIRTFSGVAKAGDEIELSFRTSGIITRLNVKAGQKIKKGAILARLDNVQANLAYEKSLSAVKSAESALLTARSTLDRTKLLYEKGSRSLSDYESARNSYQNALDQYESAQRNKSIQKSQIEYGYIYAPKSGTIALVNNELNENVNAGQVVAVLNAGKEINIDVGLPENVINKVKLGMETGLSFSALNNKKFKGRVIEVAPVADASSSTYPVKVRIVDATEAIKPGMTVDVTFNFGQLDLVRDNSIIVPVKAVGEDGAGNFVFVVESADEKTGIVKKQIIELGELTTDGFKVKKGLNAGEKIAVAGLQTLLDGQKVKLK